MSWPINHHRPGDSVNYPRNCWWVAGFSKDIGHEPVGCWMLDSPVVLYRTQDGAVVAMDDRCPHRWAPLSKGKLIEDRIECPYHGIQFEPDGSCAKIPTQTTILPKCKVKTYPVIESPPFVWLWLGDPGRISECDPPADLSWAERKDWSIASGRLRMAGNYMQLHDNVMDLTHFGFVHRDTLGQLDWVKPPKVKLTGSTVHFRQEFTDRPLSDFHRQITGTPPDLPASRFATDGTWVTPALHLATETIEFDNPGAGEVDTYIMEVVHAVTPLGMTEYEYHFLVGWNVDLPAELREALTPGIVSVFSQDKELLEAIDRTVSRDSRGADLDEIHLKSDTPQLHARRKLQELMDRE